MIPKTKLRKDSNSTDLFKDFCLSKHIKSSTKATVKDAKDFAMYRDKLIPFIYTYTSIYAFYNLLTKVQIFCKMGKEHEPVNYRRKN